MKLLKLIIGLWRRHFGHPEWYFKTCPECGFVSHHWTDQCLYCLYSGDPEWKKCLALTERYMKGEISIDEYMGAPKKRVIN